MRYNPLRASSHIKLPKGLKEKNACVNVENKDNKCLLWSVLAHDLNLPNEEHPERVTHYEPYEGFINMKDIPYPVPITSLPRFERQNARSVHVYALRWSNEKKCYDVDPVYLSSNKKEKHTNLLYVTNKDGDSHYVWIKNLSRLVHGQTTKHKAKHHICERCLHSCTSADTLKEHEKKCSQHRAQRTIYPDPDSTLKFEKIGHQHPIEFFITADLESILQPITTVLPESTHSSTTPIAKHIPCAAAYKVVSTDPRFFQPTRIFKGDNCIEHFIEAMQDDARKITKILDVNVPHNISTAERRRMIAETDECYLCKKPETDEDPFVLDHSHVDGSVRGIAHNSCNINYKTDKCNINVFVHNLKSYDAHLILSHANPEKHGRISCIPRTSEQYVSFRIGNLIFKDSLQFLGKGLDDLVSSLDKSELHTTSRFLRNYIHTINTNSSLLEHDTLGLYTEEIPGETFEIAKVKPKKRAAANQKGKAKKRRRCDFINEEASDVEGEDDDEEEEEETVSDQEFIYDSDGSDADDVNTYRAFNQQQQQHQSEEQQQEQRNTGDYRDHPYQLPELPDENLYDTLFELISSKGVYFYEYATSTDVLDETSLPIQEEFYSHLKDEHITDEEFARAQAVWSNFQMKKLWNYHDLYLITDVVLLADVILAFQKVCRSNYGIDPLHSYTTPGFGWQALLKMTDVELELLSEEQKDMYLFFEAAKRGGLSTISHRYLKANIPGRADFDPSEPNKWVMYLDANNLYGK